ncbi:MAG: radical SAM protein [Bacteroidales bacterium]
MNRIVAKTILSKLKSADSFFGISYNMNLYRGCSHGCIYCDTRSECYGVGDISQISIKSNALELLHQELKSKKRGTIGTGSMNDPYMEVEKEEEIVREALKVIVAHKFPVHIITKSNLVIRDADIIQEISSIYAAVSLTITTADDQMSKRIEPNAPSTSKRFEAMKELSKKGIYTGVTLMPLLPYINDSVANLTTLLQRAADSGASYVIPMFGVTLRKGSRDYFYGALQREFPGMMNRYDATFGNQYECWSPHFKRLQECFLEQTERLGLARKMEFYTPRTDGEQLSLF